MQTTKVLLMGVILMCHINFASAQTQLNPDSSHVTKKALYYADSLVKCSFYQNWTQYLALYCPSAIRYYGGPANLKEHVVTAYFRIAPTEHEKPESLRMLTLYNDLTEWQCVIEKIRTTYIDDRKAQITTYLIGRSEDDGLTWKFVDVSHNSLPNLGNILPEIFSGISIPIGKTVYPDDVVSH
jgi:hypothetical protein